MRAIVQIAHTLGLTPVAEGLESAAQAEALVACGCDLAQGFHLGRPLDAEATRALIVAAADRARAAATGPARVRRFRSSSSIATGR